MIHRTFYLSLTTVLIGLLLQACGPQMPAAEEPCGFSQNTFGERVSWKRTVPVPLYVHTSVPREYIGAIQEAMTVWRDEDTQLQLIRYGGEISQNGVPAQDGVSAIYWIQDWDDSRAAEQARTFIYITGDRIYEADIVINAKHFQYYTQGEASNAVHFQSLMVHEFGHVLGLAHTEEPESVMLKYLRKSEERISLAQTDRSALACEYF